MNDHQLLRYSRHILLDEISIEGQEKILAARVLVVGCGGLGAAALPYLAASGVGKLIIADHDTIDDTNLQRQTTFTEADIGQAKAQVMAGRSESRQQRVRHYRTDRKTGRNPPDRAHVYRRHRSRLH